MLSWFLLAECVMSYPSVVGVDFKFCLLEKQQLNCFFLYGNTSSSAIQGIDGTEISVVNINEMVYYLCKLFNTIF